MMVVSLVVLPLATTAQAAPSNARKVHVLQLAPARSLYAKEAIRLTKALETSVASMPDVSFVNTNKRLLRVLEEAKCGQRFTERALDEKPPLDAQADRLIESGCLEKISSLVETSGAERYVWGWLYDGGAGHLVVSVHLWQRGQPERITTLPYDGEGEWVQRVAKRIALRLLDAERVGDVRISLVKAPASGSLYVDDTLQGPWEPQRAEVTLPAGSHRFEVRGSQAVWSGQGDVVAGQARTVTLSRSEPSRVSTPSSPEPTVWPWVIGGVGVAGVVASGVFLLQQKSADGDLDKLCGNNCPPRAQDAIDRSQLSGTLWPLAGVTGLGLVGLATFLLVNQPSSPPAKESKTWKASVQPTPGGVAASWSGRF